MAPDAPANVPGIASAARWEDDTVRGLIPVRMPSSNASEELVPTVLLERLSLVLASSHSEPEQGSTVFDGQVRDPGEQLPTSEGPCPELRSRLVQRFLGILGICERSKSPLADWRWASSRIESTG